MPRRVMWMRGGDLAQALVSNAEHGTLDSAPTPGTAHIDAVKVKADVLNRLARLHAPSGHKPAAVFHHDPVAHTVEVVEMPLHVAQLLRRVIGRRAFREADLVHQLGEL